MSTRQRFAEMRRERFPNAIKQKKKKIPLHSRNIKDPNANRRRRRRGKNPQKRPKIETNAFRKALKNIPNPKPYNFIFPWDKKLKDYNLSTFCSLKAKNLIQKSEIEEVLQTLKSQVEYYEIEVDGSPAAKRVAYFWITVLVIAVLIFAYSPDWQHFAQPVVYTIVVLGIISWCIFDCSWMNKVDERAQQISDILKFETEGRFSGRNIKFKSDYISCYIEVELEELNKEKKEKNDEKNDNGSNSDLEEEVVVGGGLAPSGDPDSSVEINFGPSGNMEAERRAYVPQMSLKRGMSSIAPVEKTGDPEVTIYTPAQPIEEKGVEGDQQPRVPGRLPPMPPLPPLPVQNDLGFKPVEF